MSQFGEVDGVPLVNGTMVGQRQWRRDGLDGTLHAVATGTTWEPGENIANCGGHLNFFAQRFIDHHAGTKDHSCGFYAYFTHNLIHTMDNSFVKGLIEGYGHVTIGTRGFRCEKARILALVGDPSDDENRAVAQRYPEVPWFPTLKKARRTFPLSVPPGGKPVRWSDQQWRLAFFICWALFTANMLCFIFTDLIVFLVLEMVFVVLAMASILGGAKSR